MARREGIVVNKPEADLYQVLIILSCVANGFACLLMLIEYLSLK